MISLAISVFFLGSLPQLVSGTQIVTIKYCSNSDCTESCNSRSVPVDTCTTVSGQSSTAHCNATAVNLTAWTSSSNCSQGTPTKYSLALNRCRRIPYQGFYVEFTCSAPTPTTSTPTTPIPTTTEKPTPIPTSLSPFGTRWVPRRSRAISNGDPKVRNNYLDVELGQGDFTSGWNVTLPSYDSLHSVAGCGLTFTALSRFPQISTELQIRETHSSGTLLQSVNLTSFLNEMGWVIHEIYLSATCKSVFLYISNPSESLGVATVERDAATTKYSLNHNHTFCRGFDNYIDVTVLPALRTFYVVNTSTTSLWLQRVSIDSPGTRLDPILLFDYTAGQEADDLNSQAFDWSPKDPFTLVWVNTFRTGEFYMNFVDLTSNTAITRSLDRLPACDGTRTVDSFNRLEGTMNIALVVLCVQPILYSYNVSLWTLSSSSHQEEGGSSSLYHMVWNKHICSSKYIQDGNGLSLTSSENGRDLYLTNFTPNNSCIIRMDAATGEVLTRLALPAGGVGRVGIVVQHLILFRDWLVAWVELSAVEENRAFLTWRITDGGRLDATVAHPFGYKVFCATTHMHSYADESFSLLTVPRADGPSTLFTVAFQHAATTTTTTTCLSPTTTTETNVPTTITTDAPIPTTTTTTAVLSTTNPPTTTIAATTIDAPTSTTASPSSTTTTSPQTHLPTATTTSIPTTTVLPSSSTSAIMTTTVSPTTYHPTSTSFTPTANIPTTATPTLTTTSTPTTTPQPTRETTPPSQLCGKSYWFNGTVYDIEFTPCVGGEQQLVDEDETEEDRAARHAPMTVYNATTGVLVAKFTQVVFDWAVNSSGLFITYSSSNGDLAMVEIERDPGHFDLVADYKDSRLGNLKDFVFILKSSLVCFDTTTVAPTPTSRAPHNGSSGKGSSAGFGGITLYAAIGGGCAVLLIIAVVCVCCCLRSSRKKRQEMYDMVAVQQRGLLLNEDDERSGKNSSSPSSRQRSAQGTMTAKTFHGFNDREEVEGGGSTPNALPGDTRSKFLSVQEVTSSAFKSPATTQDSFLASGEQMTLERFNQGRQIGRGAFGIVYQGVDSESGRQVAAKELAFKSQVARERLLPGMLREVVLLKELKHTNIVRYLGHDCREGELSLWIFMEYLSGGSLRSVIDSLKKTLSPQVAAGYTKQILRGLSYIHKRGFVHRDLKADNILSDVNGVMKLADFGTTMSEESVTRMCGTPCWMAPEVVTEEEGGIGTPSDIWSLGCVVIEMLTKCEYPFSWLGKSHLVMSKLASGDRVKVNEEVVDSAKERCSSVSPEGWEFVKKCLAFSPEDRPTAQQLLIHPFIKLADRSGS